jgi:uncharacterized protein
METSRNALFLWGGAEFHEPWETSERFAKKLMERDYHVELTNDTAVLDDREMLARMDLVVVNMTMGEVSDARAANLLAAIRAGTGLGGWHGGLGDALRANTEFQFAVGGQWVAHPGDTFDYTVQVSAPDDPIMEGIGEFAVRSEQYYMHVDPAVEVLATTTFTGEHAPWIDGVVMPVAWKKRYGEGRVFYCSLGHDNAVFDIPEVATIIDRGLRWATR